MDSTELHQVRTETTLPSVAAFFSAPKEARMMVEHHKLRKCAIDHLRSRPHHAIFGGDSHVSQLAAAAGFKQVDLVVGRVAVGSSYFTAVCVPTRVWRNPERRIALLHVKEQARQIGTRCLLMPQRWLRSTARERIAKAVSQARRVRYSNADVGVVIAHVRSCGLSSVGRCASLLQDHSDPFGAVMAMCARGVLHIERSSKLDQSTVVRLKVFVASRKATQ